MPKLSKLYPALSILLLATLSLAFAAEETITITTYYPAPYGSYNELYVASNVGIGTTSPQRLLDIAANSATEVTNLRLTNSAWGANQLNTLEFFSGVTGSNNLVTSAIKSKLYSGGLNGELQFWTNNNQVLTQQMTILNNGNVGIGTPSPEFKITTIASDNFLRLRRESTETTGGKILFLELFQNDPSNVVPEVYPIIRFHHNNKFWNRIEARTNGIHFKEGNLPGDSYVKTWAGDGYFSGNVGIGTTGPDDKLDIYGTPSQTVQNVLGIFNTNNALATLNTGAAIIMGYRTAGYYAKIATVFESQNPDYLRPALAFYTMDSSYLPGTEVERMRIKANGNVGIGMASPEDKLHITSGATTGAAAITATPTLTLGTSAGSYGAIKLYSGAQWSPVGKYALIHVTNGNLHLDAADDIYGTYINWYGGSGGTHIGNGAAGYGALTKGSGTFNIPHPVPAKAKAGWRLQHSFVESPTRGDNLYRWQVNVKNGQAEIDLPDYFRYLNENVQVWISPVKHFGRAYAEINADMTKILITAEQDGNYNVLAMGTRKDKTAKENFDKLGVEYKNKDPRIKN